MINFLFRLTEKSFIKYLNKKNSIKLTKDNMVFAFHDLEGRAYYKFSKDMELPLMRTAEIQKYFMWITKGVDEGEYIKVLDYAEAALVNGIKDGKSVAKIGYALSELKDRTKMVIHHELFYNVIASQLIRDDENPKEINNEIQMQKVAAFKAMDDADDTFFLAIQELLEQFGLSRITRDQYKSLLSESRVQVAKLERMLKSA